MRVYLQDANGREFELNVHEPDPQDGTYIVTAFVDRNGDSIWFRIFPED